MKMNTNILLSMYIVGLFVSIKSISVKTNIRNTKQVMLYQNEDNSVNSIQPTYIIQLQQCKDNSDWKPVGFRHTTLQYCSLGSLGLTTLSNLEHELKMQWLSCDDKSVIGDNDFNTQLKNIQGQCPNLTDFRFPKDKISISNRFKSICKELHKKEKLRKARVCTLHLDENFKTIDFLNDPVNNVNRKKVVKTITNICADMSIAPLHGCTCGNVQCNQYEFCHLQKETCFKIREVENFFTDENGCRKLTHIWCEVKQRCLRPWVESCPISKVPHTWWFTVKKYISQVYKKIKKSFVAVFSNESVFDLR